jgi:hypothetical protein
MPMAELTEKNEEILNDTVLHDGVLARIKSSAALSLGEIEH